MNKEIGGYIELEHYRGRQFHENAIKLNCARNCLAYLIKLRNIKRIYIPYFLCDSVLNVCKKYNVEVKFYHIDENFLPVIPKGEFSKNWLYLVNYYGQLTNEKICEYSKSINNLIVDNVQAFFQEAVDRVPTIYTCRKFFGVADGAYLYSEKKLNEELEIDSSYDRMTFLLGRYEKSASEFYSEYVANNKLFTNEPIKQISPITENFMRSFDYKSICKARTENFLYLNEQFSKINKLNLSVPEGAFMYPLYLENGAEIRKKLQQEKIYIPTLWPDVFDICKESDLEYDYAKSILPIPLDQRYGKEEMAYIAGRIMACIN